MVDLDEAIRRGLAMKKAGADVRDRKSHARGEAYLIRERISALQERLDARRFARIHRTAIVNLAFVREMRPWFNSAFVVLLDDGTELRLSRRYRARLAGTIGEYL